MATEEKEGGNSRITSKLFELSIEKFEKMEKEVLKKLIHSFSFIL